MMTTQTSAEHRSHVVIDSPIGPLTLVAEDGRLVGLYMAVASHAPDASTLGAPAVREPAPGENAPGEPDEALTATASQLEDYFAGSLTSFDLPLALVGTEFQRAVWAALLEIPYGATISYGELARRIGLPSASRAVGMANGRNPVSIVVPCHRVVGADGSLTGYGGGVNRKRFLLALEQRVSGQTLA